MKIKQLNLFSFNQSDDEVNKKNPNQLNEHPQLDLFLLRKFITLPGTCIIYISWWNQEQLHVFTWTPNHVQIQVFFKIRIPITWKQQKIAQIQSNIVGIHSFNFSLVS